MVRELKVLWSIVVGHFVLVVNDFVVEQGTSEHSAHYEPVLWHVVANRIRMFRSIDVNVATMDDSTAFPVDRVRSRSLRVRRLRRAHFRTRGFRVRVSLHGIVGESGGALLGASGSRRHAAGDRGRIADARAELSTTLCRLERQSALSAGQRNHESNVMDGHRMCE